MFNTQFIKKCLLIILTSLICITIFNHNIVFLYAETNIVKIPSEEEGNDIYGNNGIFMVPNSSDNYALSNEFYNTNKNIVLFGSDNLVDTAGQAIVQSKKKYNILKEDLEIVFNLDLGANYSGSSIAKDRGLAFVLHNDSRGSNISPGGLSNGDYGRLGLYGAGNNQEIKNAIAIEFDQYGRGSTYTNETLYDSSYNIPKPSGDAPHIAITRPVSPTSGKPIHHEATLFENIDNRNGIKTVKVSWKKIDDNSTIIITDDTYELKYEFYVSKTNFLGSGSKKYTYSEAKSLFGNSEEVYLAFTGSMGTLPKGASISFPQIYKYQVNYYIETVDGIKTTTKVPGLSSISKSSVEGTLDVGPLPQAPLGYYISNSSNQSTVVQVLPNNNNVYNFYYKLREDIPYTVKYYFEQDGGFVEKSALRKNEFGYTGQAVNAPTLNSATASSLLSNEEIIKLKNGYDFVNTSYQGITSNQSGNIFGDGSLILNMYYKAKTDIRYKVIYTNSISGEKIADEVTGIGKFNSKINLTANLIEGYTVINNSGELILNNPNPNTIDEYANIYEFKYVPKDDTEYSVSYYLRKFEDDINSDDINGYYTDGSSILNNNENKPDLVSIYKGTTDSFVEAPLLDSNDNNFKGYYLDSNKSITQSRVKGDGSTILRMYYEAYRYPFYVERYIQKQDGSYELFNRIMPGTRGYNTIRGLRDFNIEGYSFDSDNTSNIKSGYVKYVNNPTAAPTTDLLSNSANEYMATFEGLVLRGYYTPTTVSYKIIYQDTKGVLLHDSVVKETKYGYSIEEQAVDIIGYSVDSFKKVKTMGLNDNVITFTYTPQEDIKYSVKYYTGNSLIGTLNYYDGIANQIKTALKVSELGDTPNERAIKDSINNSNPPYIFDENLSINSMSKPINPNGTTVLEVYYTRQSGEPYKVEYYLENGNNEYFSLAESSFSYGTSDEEVTILNKNFEGYIFDENNINNNSSGNIIANHSINEEPFEGLVLKRYYKANTNTKYNVYYYTEDENGNEVYNSKNFKLDSYETLFGKTGQILKYGESNGELIKEIPGYSYINNSTSYYNNSDLTVESKHNISGNGNTIVKIYYSANEVNYTVKHYREYRQSDYSGIPLGDGKFYIEFSTILNPIEVVGNGKIGSSVIAELINTSNNTVNGSKYFGGFVAIEAMSTRTKVLGNSENTLEIYYNALVNQPYRLNHIQMKPSGNELIEYDDNVDATTGATINKQTLAKSYPGYDLDTTKVDGIYNNENLSVISKDGVKKIYYPYVVGTENLKPIVNIYYKPRLDTPYKIEHYINNDLVVTENLTQMSDSRIEAKYLDGTLNNAFKGYVPDISNPNTINSGIVEGNGSTTLKLYYGPATDTPYSIEIYLSNADENYSVDSNYTIKKAGTTGEIVTGEIDNIEGYSFDSETTKNLNTSAIAGDGSTVLKQYFKVNSNTSYTVKYYKQALDGTYSEKDVLVENQIGKTNQEVSVVPMNISGYSYDSSISTISGSVKADGSLILKVFYKRNSISYVVNYYYQSLNGDFNANPDNFSTGTGKVEEEITITPKKVEGFEFDSSNENNILTLSLSNDGTSIFKVYYLRKSSINYSVKIYELNTNNGNEISLNIPNQIDNTLMSGSGKFGEKITYSAPVINGFIFFDSNESSFYIGNDYDSNQFKIYYVKMSDTPTNVILIKNSDGSYSIIGNAQPGSIVKLLDSNGEIFNPEVNANTGENGIFNIVLPNDVPHDSQVNLVSIETGKAKSNPYSLYIDKMPPDAPSIDQVHPGDTKVNITASEFEGVIKLYKKDENSILFEIGSVLVPNDGSKVVSVSINSPLASSDTLVAKQIDKVGNISDESIAITVNEESFDENNITGISVKTPPTKTDYHVGENFDPSGIVITLTDKNGKTKDVNATELAAYGITFEPLDNLSAGTTSVTVKKDNLEAVIAIRVGENGTVSPTPEHTAVTVVDNVIHQEVGRTCQDDGYPRGYYWDGYACIIDKETIQSNLVVESTSQPTITPTINSNPDATIEPRSTPTPTPISTSIPHEETNEDEIQIRNPKLGSWSLINLGLLVSGLILMCILLLSKNSKEEIESRHDINVIVVYKRKTIYRILGILIEIISLILFVTTQNLKLKMILIDKYTIFMALLLTLLAICFYLGRKWIKVRKINSDDFK
ncbi:bacterial Ig-like domain-containing protein [Anaerorhabdus sp.]|uniref:bacterial Ig-like domain-containing protein n=1 Tax=Anaerorhabdus sp. TaxID=1872524 RepID=UPI002B21BC5C|nr:bacterial Ig-like domain-containing protein [Anaerorhabdus sp.]MEA4874626.1 bacterial Ig-like domain-containing protein [Anaerorhabdus sp.]